MYLSCYSNVTFTLDNVSSCYNNVTFKLDNVSSCSNVTFTLDDVEISIIN